MEKWNPLEDRRPLPEPDNDTPDKTRRRQPPDALSDFYKTLDEIDAEIKRALREVLPDFDDIE